MIWFIHQDDGADSRQSDGLAFLFFEEDIENNLYFGCLDYGFVSRTPFEKDAEPELEGKKMRPATLNEICTAGKWELIDTILETEVDEKSQNLIETYIHLKT